MSALRAKANATSTGSASGTVTYPSRRDTSSTCVFTPPQNPHKSASAAGGPHKTPRTKRHYPAQDGTAASMALSALESLYAGRTG